MCQGPSPTSGLLIRRSYIHGGAWRDPEVDSRSFEPAVEVLWNSPLKNAVAGFASINYRLSPYPSHSNNPSSPNDPARNVHYPDHLVDVAHALIYLEDNFHIEDRYILAGHSAGATMAFELHSCYINGKPLPKPSCVLGIAGIYNFEAFLEAHKRISAYKELMDNAFPDRGVWKEASPYHSHFPGLANWEHAKAVVISHSDQDELVEKAQTAFMLERVRMTPHSEGKIHFLEASGAHDEIWQSGHILADLISKSLQLG